MEGEFCDLNAGVCVRGCSQAKDCKPNECCLKTVPPPATFERLRCSDCSKGYCSRDTHCKNGLKCMAGKCKPGNHFIDIDWYTNVKNVDIDNVDIALTLSLSHLICLFDVKAPESAGSTLGLTRRDRCSWRMFLTGPAE